MDENKKTMKKKVIIIRKKKKTLKSTKEKHKENEQINKKEENKKEENKKEENIKEKRNKYIVELDEKEKLALEIAKDHLKSSFDLEKSIDFINWNNKK